MTTSSNLSFMWAHNARDATKRVEKDENQTLPHTMPPPQPPPPPIQAVEIPPTPPELELKLRKNNIPQLDMMPKKSVIYHDICEYDVNAMNKKQKPAIVDEIGITGCRFIGQDKGFWKRLLWVILLTACTGLTIYQMQKQIQLYFFSANIATNLDLEIKNELKFPAVTLCSSAKIRMTAMGKLLIELGYGPDQMQHLERIKSDLPGNRLLQKISAQKNSFILECSWWDGPCTDEEIVVTATNTGLCFTINGGRDSNRTTSSVGVEGSLSLILNIEFYENVYLESCEAKQAMKGQHSGVMVKIHDHEEVPMFENSLQLPTGFTHSLRMVEMKKELISEQDGGTCNDDQKLTHFNAKDRSEHYLGTCQMDRLISAIESTCRCRPFLSPAESSSTSPECSLSQHFDCVSQFLFGSGGSHRRPYNSDDCRRGCVNTDYWIMQGFSSLPDKILDTAVLGRTFVFTNESESEEACEGNLISRNKTVQMRKEFLHATEVKWQSSYTDAMKKKSYEVMAVMEMTFQQLVTRGFAPYRDAYLPAYERLQKTSQCFNTITTNYTGYINTVSILLDVFPNAFAMTVSPDMSEILKYFSVNNDALSLASYLVQGLVQFKQILQVYAEDNYYNKKIRSETLEYVMHLMESVKKGGVKSFAVYEEMISNPNIQRLTGELDAILQTTVEDDFTISVLNVLDKTSVTTQYALKYAESLNNGDALGNATLMGMFAMDPFTADLNDIRAFVSLLLDCSRHHLPNTVGEILGEWRFLYGTFKLAYADLLKHTAIVSDEFIWGPKFIKENLLAVNIHFGDLQVQNIKQQRTYTGWSLLCDVGGTLGLFLGASILTLFEGLYLLYNFCMKQN